MSHTTRKEGVYELWNVFAAARDFDEITETYSRLERVCDGRVRAALSTHYRAKRLVASLDTKIKRTKAYHAQRARGTSVLVVGAGPAGLRAAIEASFYGASVIVIEKRPSFSRNNRTSFNLTQSHSFARSLAHSLARTNSATSLGSYIGRSQEHRNPNSLHQPHEWFDPSH